MCGKSEKDANYQEVDLFPITTRQHRASPRAKKRLASSLAQKKLNEKNRLRHFTQTAHTNFTENDKVVHLTYQDEHLPCTEEEAFRCFELWIERMNYLRRKLGLPPCKYMGALEGPGKKEMRWHHHVIIDGLLSDKEMMRLWSTGRGKNKVRLGGAKIEYLDFEGNGGTIIGLCEYIMKDPIGKRRWRQSRNIIQPARPRPNDGRYSRSAVQRIATTCLDDEPFWRTKYPGWELVEPAQATYNDFTGWSVYARLRRVHGARDRPK